MVLPSNVDDEPKFLETPETSPGCVQVVRAWGRPIAAMRQMPEVAGKMEGVLRSA
jgi:hypothetical protein